MNTVWWLSAPGCASQVPNDRDRKLTDRYSPLFSLFEEDESSLYRYVQSSVADSSERVITLASLESLPGSALWYRAEYTLPFATSKPYPPASVRGITPVAIQESPTTDRLPGCRSSHLGRPHPVPQDSTTTSLPSSGSYIASSRDGPVAEAEATETVERFPVVLNTIDLVPAQHRHQPPAEVVRTAPTENKQCGKVSNVRMSNKQCADE